MGFGQLYVADGELVRAVRERAQREQAGAAA